MSSIVYSCAKSRLSPLWATWSIGVLIALLSVGLVACGSEQGSQPPSTASVQGLHCGKIQAGPSGKVVNTDAAKQATNCFWQAFQQCHPASLVFIAGGVDTVTTQTFTIKNNSNPCTISETVQSVMGPNPPSVARTYTCAGLAQKPDGLHFASCGEDGNVFVPSVGSTIHR